MSGSGSDVSGVAMMMMMMMLTTIMMVVVNQAKDHHFSALAMSSQIRNL